MTSRDFCYWLQGYFEISGVKRDGGFEMTDEQIDMIRRHLRMVFIHEIDPSFPAHQQDALNEAHRPSNLKPLGGHGPYDSGLEVMC